MAIVNYFIMQMGDHFALGACYQNFTDNWFIYGSPVLLDSVPSNNILAPLAEPISMPPEEDRSA